MILGSKKLARELADPTDKKDPLIITPSPDQQLISNSLAGAIDLRLGCWFSMLRQSRCSILDLATNNSESPSGSSLTKLHYVPFGKKFVLHPRSFVLGVTIEWLRIPASFAGYVTSRSSWGRRGLIIATAIGVHPDFTGCLTLELTNAGEVPIALYPGLAICQLFLHTVDTDGESDTILNKPSSFAGRRLPLLGDIKLDKIAEKLTKKSASSQ